MTDATNPTDCENKRNSDLFKLPLEIFLHVCSFLDSASLNRLSLTCRRAECLLINWINVANSTSGSRRAARREKLFWSAPSPSANENSTKWEWLARIKDDHIGSAILARVCGSTCVVYTGHDELICKNLDGSDVARCRKFGHTFRDAPNNCLTIAGHRIHACNHNNTIDSWTLTNAGFVSDTTFRVNPFKPYNLLLCISNCFEESFFATGSQREYLHAFDRRAGYESIKRCRAHNCDESVRGIVIDARYIFSIGTNATTTNVVIWDRRSERRMKSIALCPNFHYGYQASLDVRHGWICVAGDRFLHVLDPQDDYESVKSHFVEGNSIITKLRLTRGCMTMSFWDGTVKMFQPTDPPMLVTTLSRTEQEWGVHSMDYSHRDGVVAKITQEDISVYRRQNSWNL